MTMTNAVSSIYLNNWQTISSSEEVNNGLANADVNQILVFYFGYDGCAGCENIKVWLNGLPNNYPNGVFCQVIIPSELYSNHPFFAGVGVFPSFMVFKNFPTVKKQVAFITGSDTNNIVTQINKWYQ
ncbi:hypothetical protein SAMD00019534_110160, partial [Acytostelium subglobosum LB1]|uniref:hypothetical protein n=1 Tax=Acytostelium subglobosum LB1 TaxID=1410327 RepID=UPI000644D378